MLANPRVRRAIQRQERLIDRGELPAIIVVRIDAKSPRPTASEGPEDPEPWTWAWFWLWVQRIGAVGSLISIIVLIVGFIVLGFRI